MAANNQARRRSVARQSTELMNASTQVVAHRMTRMALAGPVPSARDRKEFQRMFQEKQQAFVESWVAMLGHTAQTQMALGTTAWRSWFYPWWRGGNSPSVMASTMQQAGMGMLQKGMAPVHRKAVANARRLAKTPLR